MQVTIRGRVATVYLARDVEARVERTPWLDDMIAQGFAELIAEHPDPAPVVAAEMPDTKTQPVRRRKAPSDE